MTFIDAETLRRNAIERLRELSAAPWVIRALEEGAVTIRHAASRWSASEGDFAAHAVTLGVDAGALARLDADPHARELLLGALSGATARRPLESVSDLSLAWDGTAVTEAQSYRGAQRAKAPASLDEALRAWLDATGDAREAPWSLQHAREQVTLRGPRPDEPRRERVERALRALTGARAVRWERG
ncbi:MAG: hypothetical protein R3A48_21415 [Polyangiales bacterium]